MIYQQFQQQYDDIPFDYKTQRAEYRAAIKNITAQFKAALAVEYHLSGYNPAISDTVWELAWEDGHSHGYSEVEIHYADFAAFAEKIVAATPTQR